MSDLSGKTTIVVGASRGLGHGVATAFAEAGAHVVAVSRTSGDFDEPIDGAGTIESVIADAGDASVPGDLLERYKPTNIILVAGEYPPIGPLHEQTWESFSVNWNSDVRIAFHWLRETLLRPLPPGSRVVVFSSGAALNGSPASGGYAGAKSTQRFITGYAQEEAKRSGLDITYTALLPRMTSSTDFGMHAARAYAKYSGITEEEQLRQMGEPLTPQTAGTAVVELVKADAADVGAAYLLTAAGVKPLP